MLHILWMIIKFILILLGIILGLLLLAVMLVLFCPFRYHVSADKQDEDFKKTSLYASFSWLFHGVWVRIWFQEGKLVPKINLFGIPIHKILEMRKRKAQKEPEEISQSLLEELEEEMTEETVKELPKPRKEAEEELPKPKKEETAEELPKPKKEETAEELPEPKKEEIEKELPKPKKEEAVEEIPESETEEEAEEEFAKAAGIIERIKNILDTLSGKLKDAGQSGSMAEKLAGKINTVRDKLQGILDKIKWWKNFLTHTKVKGAVRCVKRAVFKILKHVIPTRLYGNMIVGSEDPSTTGTILAVLGITMPFHKNCIEVTPVFDGTNILKGNVHLKGRIYVIVLVYQALKVLINKNVRYTIKYWKNKEES